jgi:hypothetical protein
VRAGRRNTITISDFRQQKIFHSGRATDASLNPRDFWSLWPLCETRVRTTRADSPDGQAVGRIVVSPKRAHTGEVGVLERRTAVAGERDLEALLRDMRPEMQEGIFVFCTIADDAEIPAAISPLLTFREREGTTLVMRRGEAESAGLRHQFASRLITLTVHSSLDAVGFLAAITARLAEAGIGVNAVSAFYHDHLFVPDHRAAEALALLQKMSAPERG